MKIELPFSIGDTVYSLYQYEENWNHPRIVTAIVDTIEIYADYNGVVVEINRTLLARLDKLDQQIFTDVHAAQSFVEANYA